jgi:hypothetical protein
VDYPDFAESNFEYRNWQQNLVATGGRGNSCKFSGLKKENHGGRDAVANKFK